MKLRFQKSDILAISAVLLLAVIVFVAFLPKAQATAAYAEIYVDGKLYTTVSLAEDREFTVTGKYTNTVTVRDGKIAVTESDCQGGDCVSCGWQSKTNRTIVCLPNAMEIRILAGDSDVDFVVG